MEGKKALPTAAWPVFQPIESLLLFGFASCSFDVRIFGTRDMTELQFLRGVCCMDIIFRPSLAWLQTQLGLLTYCSFSIFSCGCAYLNDISVKLQDRFWGLVALTAQVRALFSSAFFL
jgi:hypothetical protein